MAINYEQQITQNLQQVYQSVIDFSSILKESYKAVLEENQQLKHRINLLNGKITTLNQRINDIELALLGDDKLYEQLQETYHAEDIQSNETLVDDDGFVYRNQRNKLQK